MCLQLDCGAEIRCRVVLLALGVRWRRLEADGADRFAGAGIYYACTTVEADLYDGTDVAVVGGGNSAGQAVMFLAECCPTRTVHLLIRRTLGPGMSEYLVAAHPGDRQRRRPRTDRNRGGPRRASRRGTFAAKRGGAEAPRQRALCGRVRVHRRRAGGGVAAGGDCSRRQWLSADRHRRRSLGLVAPQRIATRARWKRRCRACWPPETSARDRQARRLRGRRRLAGGDLRPSLAVDQSLILLDGAA